ncbi:MAG: tetratricopeptide repeat protein [Candidatus Eisenbacteria bacterium]
MPALFPLRLALAAVLLVALAATRTQAAPAVAAPPSTALADTLYSHRDWVGAARAYEKVAKVAPTMPRVQYRLGVCYANLEQWQRAIDAGHRADALGALPVFARYNLACAFARAGQPDSAFAVLGRLMDAGYRQPDALDADADLGSLRGDARFAGIRERAKRNATPCEYAPESRQFDFWIGDWEVRDNRGGQVVVGASHVEKILGGCVIFENWSGGLGGSGKSFNAWNPELRCWQQNWMDDSGSVSNFTDGHSNDGRLVFVAEKLGADGKPFRNRLSFFDLGPDQVRQFSEQSTDGGATWTVVYDFNYLRRKT